jgi:hypothetical protein
MPAPYLKISEISPGDVVVLDQGFTCHPGGKAVVHRDPDKTGKDALYVYCDEGRHYLVGQCDDERGIMTGVRRLRAWTGPQNAHYARFLVDPDAALKTYLRLAGVPYGRLRWNEKAELQAARVALIDLGLELPKPETTAPKAAPSAAADGDHA